MENRVTDNVCPNCGAGMHNKEYALICDHCGTVIFDYATLAMDGTPFFARMKMPDGSIAVMKLKSYGGRVTYEADRTMYADDAMCRSYISNNSCCVEMDFWATPFETPFKKDTLLIKSERPRTTVEDYERNPIWPDGRD